MKQHIKQTSKSQTKQNRIKQAQGHQNFQFCQTNNNLLIIKHSATSKSCCLVFLNKSNPEYLTGENYTKTLKMSSIQVKCEDIFFSQVQSNTCQHLSYWYFSNHVSHLVSCHQDLLQQNLSIVYHLFIDKLFQYETFFISNFTKYSQATNKVISLPFL